MNNFFGGLKNLDENTYKIMKYGLLFSGLVCLTAVCILLIYIFLGINFLYHLGLSLIKSSFTFAVEFIICGIIVDFIKNKGIWNMKLMQIRPRNISFSLHVSAYCEI